MICWSNVVLDAHKGYQMLSVPSLSRLLSPSITYSRSWWQNLSTILCGLPKWCVCPFFFGATMWMIFDSGLLYYLTLFGVYPALFGRIPCADDSISMFACQPGCCGVFSSCSTSPDDLDIKSEAEAFSTYLVIIPGLVTFTSLPVRPSWTRSEQDFSWPTALTSAERLLHSTIACRVVLDIRDEVHNPNREICVNTLPKPHGTQPRPTIIPNSPALEIIDITERHQRSSEDV
jgi:hypothetical protein